MTGKDGKDGKVYSLIFWEFSEFREGWFANYVISGQRAAKTFPSFPLSPSISRNVK
jgi:hypothetical protein